MRKELEYAKKIAVITKLFHSELLSEKEYEKIRRKLMDSYHACSWGDETYSKMFSYLIFERSW